MILNAELDQIFELQSCIVCEKLSHKFTCEIWFISYRMELQVDSEKHVKNINKGFNFACDTP